MILSRLPSSRHSEILPGWTGKTAIILAGGPSLTEKQVEIVRFAREFRHDIRVIAVNDTYLLAPWADVCYAADCHWHKWQSKGYEKAGFSSGQVRENWAAFLGQKCTIENSGENVSDDAVHMLRNYHGQVHGFGLSSDSQMLVTGRNSGFQALNLAVLAGSKQIILLGFDAKNDAQGKSHWFGEHPESTQTSVYKYYQQAMSAVENDLVEIGVDVINCSPDSAIDTWPKMALEDVL